MADYKFYKNQSGTSNCGLIYTGKAGRISYIPLVEDNRDYKLYLEWAKTNTADPAD